MGTHNGLMRIFWPSDAPTGPLPGVLVGFRNSELDVFVVSILQEVEVRTGQNGRKHSSQCLASPCRQCARGRDSVTAQPSRHQRAAYTMWALLSLRLG